MRPIVARLFKLFREPLWLWLFGALVIGVVGGTLMGRLGTPDAAAPLFGRSWQGDANETRGVLTTLLGIQLTVLTIVLSLNAPLMQSAANQYSPRLVPFYLRHAPLRVALPIFVLSGGFIVAAVRQVGLARDAVRPRPVLSVAVLLSELAFVVLVIAMLRTFRFMRVERILGLVRRSTSRAIWRLRRRVRRLAVDPRAELPLPDDAVALRARTSGYLTDVDPRGLARTGRRAGARVRICRMVGDFVDEGEVVGWAMGEAGAPMDPKWARRLERWLQFAHSREDTYDPLYGVRIMADVASRAKSSSANDGYTSRQALQQIRSLLRSLAGTPTGDCNVVDVDGTVRVSVIGARLRDFISAAVEAPLRYGADDPEVLDGVLEIALEVGLAACDAEGRMAAHQLIIRVLDDATEYGKLSNGRLQRLMLEADLVRASLERDSPRPDRHARADWVLTGEVRPSDAPIPD